MENHPVSCLLNIIICNYPRGTSSVIYEKKHCLVEIFRSQQLANAVNNPECVIALDNVQAKNKMLYRVTC